MTKEQRSSKWTFLFYKESAPADYLEVLEELHIPFILSPWHDKDINRQTGELKNLTNTELSSLILSKVINKFLS